MVSKEVTVESSSVNLASIICCYYHFGHIILDLPLPVWSLNPDMPTTQAK